MEMTGLDAAISTSLAEGGIGNSAPTNPTPPAPVAAPAAPESTPAAPAAPTNPYEQPKTGLDSLPDLNAPVEEAAATEANPSTGEIQPGEPVSPQKAKWNELREKATELDKVKPELDTLRQQLQELKEKPSIPDEVQREIEELRQLRFAVELEQTPEWNQAVKAPSQEVLNQFQQIAEFYNVDYKELVAAADDTNPLRRGKSIREFLERSDTNEVTADVVAIATNAAEKLHGIYSKMAELRGRSSEAYASLEAKRSMESEQQQLQRDQKYSASHKEVVGVLEARLPDFFKNPELAKAIREARPATEPQEQAFQVAASVLIAPMASELKQARAEIAKLQKQVAARSAAVPGLGTSPSQETKPQGMSLDDAIRADFSGGRY